MRDDSVGLRVAQEVERIMQTDPDIEVGLDYWGGLRLMERMIGFDRAIVIDAIQTGSDPGTIHFLSPDEIPTQRSASAHDVNLPTALEFGRTAGAHLPRSDRILLIGIEAADVQTFDESLTQEVEAAVPIAVESILARLREGQEADDLT
ncbi:MAG: hydrogenase maturation protease [Anaerolineales bacterium]|nr:hydrogenase maturation protease [Anaerolineales bacterium]